MTKIKVGMRYELCKLLKTIGIYLLGAAIVLLAIQLIFQAIGFESVGYSGVDPLIYIFLMFWTVIVFGKDAGFLLQSGLTRREVFLIFLVAVAVEALVFSLLSVMLSLILSSIWPEQFLFLRMTGSSALTVLVQLFLLYLAVTSCSFAVTVLERRIGTGWTAMVVIGLFFFISMGLPALLSLMLGGMDAYGNFITALMDSPNISVMFSALYLVVSLATLALTWLLLRRANADRFAAGR